MTRYFLSCDWGTTSFRLRLATVADGTIIADVTSAQGIALVHELWQQSNLPAEKRAAFYVDVIGAHIKQIEKEINQSLDGVKVVISGMASSTIGIIDIPYAEAPLPVNASGMETRLIPANDTFPHDTLIISGIRTTDDVMRGEETQLIGCIESGRRVKNELFIFPGTHSKHIQVSGDRIIDFKTFMTGELFGLLVQNSILKGSVEQGIEDNMDSFIKGVNDALHPNLLHHIFKVRTNRLFDVYSKSENYGYLSGLLIGTELKDLIIDDAETVNLVCGNNLHRFYQTALQELLPAKRLNIYTAQKAHEFVVTGQIRIAKHLKIFA